MSSSVPQASARVQRVLPDTAPIMAKAHIRKADVADYRRQIAQLVEGLWAGLTLKEVQARIETATGKTVDERQLARWASSADRPQFDVLFAVEEWRVPIVLAYARLAATAVEIETVVRVRRTNA